MNYGFIEPIIETHEQGIDHVLGSANLPEPVIHPSGDWLPLVSVGEKQNRNGIETNGCVFHGEENAIEESIYLQTGVRPNHSERYLTNYAKAAGVLDPDRGSDPHKAAELRREVTGTIPEERAPWTDDIKTKEQYFSLDYTSLKPEAVKWYGDWKMTHKWLWTTQISPAEKRVRIQEALTKGTVCGSVRAWKQKDGLYYKEVGEGDNHWVNIVQAKDNLPYKVQDSYPETEGDFIKDLDPLYDFGFAKVYFVTPAPHIFLKNLGFQMMDEEVKHLQKALVSLGYSIPHAVTNTYGTETRSAVWQFQVKNGIADDGTHFGPRTRLAMNRALQPTLGMWESLVLAVRTYAGI